MTRQHTAPAGPERGAAAMISLLASQIRQYKRDTLLAPLCTALEVLMELLIPFITAATTSISY